MKSYTDIEQSKKLAEILPLESADMSYTWDFEDEQYYINTEKFSNWIIPKYAESAKHKQVIPCWSIAALFNLCPTINGKQPILTRGKITRLWYCYYEDEMDTQTYDNPVDACVAMIEELHEQKLL